MKALIRNFLVILLSLAVVSGCGVKGKPMPPKTPPPLGRGEPVHKEKEAKAIKSKTPSAEVAE